MSALAKVFVVFVFLLSILFFGTSATLYLTREDWAKNYDEFKEEVTKSVAELKARNSNLKGERDALEARLLLVSKDELQKAGTIQTLRNELKGKDAQIANISATRDEAINAKTATDNVNASLVSQNTTLTGQLDEAHDKRDDAIDSQKVANAEKFRMKRDLDATTQELHEARVEHNTLSEKFDSLELAYGAVEKKLGKDGIEAILSGLVSPPIDALVEEVDSNLNLVVLSVGSQDEVKEGVEFTIYREDKFVGKVRVNKVYENLAGARVLFTAEGSDIRQGDRATTRIN
jgi:chromosome segregation ATPase